MFNLQGSELVIILLLALVVLGPEKLPEAMRRLGQVYAQLKKMSTGFQQEFKAAVDEPMREVRETANMLRDSMDFRTLQDGERPEKPKSGDMAAVTPPVVPNPPVPTEDVPFREPPPPEGHPIDVPVETPAEENLVDETLVDETLVDESVVDESVVDETLVDEGVAVETPADHTPAEPATDEVTREW